MKVLHTADVHLGLATYGRGIAEFGLSLEKFVDVALVEKVDLAAIAGDLCHGRRPGPEELAIIARELHRLSEAGIKTVIGPGNHDGMVTIANPDTHTLGWLAETEMPNVWVATEPHVYRWPGEFSVAVLPYAHRRAIETEGLSLPERTAEASRVLAETIEGMAVPDRQEPMVFVGHLSTTFAELGSERAMQMGWDTVVDPTVFDGFDFAALGHIHVGQKVSDKAYYAGSPDVHGFGEVAADKRFLLVNVRLGEIPVVTVIPTKPRELVVIRAREDAEWSLGDWPPAWPEGTIVRLELYPSTRVDVAAVERGLVDQVTEAGASFVETKVIGSPATLMQPRLRDGAAKLETFDGQVDLWLDTQKYPNGDPLDALDRDRVKAMAARVVAQQ